MIVDIKIITNGSVAMARKSFVELAEEISAYHNKLKQQNEELIVAQQQLLESKRKLQEREEKYRLIAENTSDVIWVLNVNRKIFTYISPSIIKLRGFTPEEAMNQGLDESLTPEHAKIIENDLQEAVPRFIKDPEQDLVVVRDVQQPCKDGSVRWVQVSVKYTMNDRHEVELIGVSRDVQKSKEEEIRKQRQLELQAVFLRLSNEFVTATHINMSEKIDAALAELGQYFTADIAFYYEVSDDQKIINNTNDWYATHIDNRAPGLKDAAVDDYPWITAFFRNAQTVYIKDIELLPESAVSEKIEFTSRGMKSVVMIPVVIEEKVFGVIGLSTLNSCLLISEEELTYFKMFANTLADAKTKIRADVALLKAKVQAEKADKAKSVFLSSMSHEIRTPMNVINGIGDLLADTELNSTQKEYVKMIRNSSELLLGIINDILDFSRIEAGKFKLECSSFDIATTIEETVNMQKLMASSKGLKLSFYRCDTMPAFVIGDKHRLQQVLTNIIGNAIKFTEKGEIIVTCSTVDHNIFFSVKDTGIGIKKGNIDKLFTRFTQAHDDKGKYFEGSGLGLVICKNIVEMMGGKIGVNSKYGEGSTFYFQIPLEKDIEKCCQHLPANYYNISRDKSSATSQDNVVTNLSSEQLQILLVEDKQLNQKLATILLEQQGWQVTIADNGQVALTKYAESDYDIVLMDISMPVMDGIQALAAIKELQIDKKDHTPIVAMTANALAGDRESYLEQGFSGYIPKPINKKQLFETILQLTGGISKAKKQKAHADSIGSNKASEDMQDMAKQVALYQEIRDHFVNELKIEEEMLAQLMMIFIEDTYSDIEILVNATKQSDKAQFFQTLQSIKGEAGNLGLKNTRTLCLELEKLGKAGKLEENEINKKITELKKEISSLELLINSL